MIRALTPDRWTPIAYRVPGAWSDGWAFGRDFSEHEIRRAHDADEIIVMHQADTLVARVAGPCWKRLRARMRQGRA
jgi:hypothetical protein